MSQIIENNTTSAPLAEVTKSRPNLENSLNNASGNLKSPTTKKSKKNKNHTAATTTTIVEKEVESCVQVEVQPAVVASQNKSHKEYVRPWSSMTTQELAQWAKDTGLDQEEEGTAQPSRRRMPKSTQVRTTTTTVPNTPVSASPASKKQTTATSAARSAGSSPLYGQPPQAFPQFPAHSPAQPGSSPTMVPSSSFEQALSMQKTFSNSSYGVAAGRSSTPPEEYLSQHQSQVSEPVYVVSVRQNDPYAFNVIGDAVNASSMSTTGTVAGAYASYYASNNLMNTSLDSVSTVGYVNSAEVSPVKAGQHQERGMTFTAYPQRRADVADDSMDCSTTSDASTKKHQRVYVNGRPVIKA